MLRSLERDGHTGCQVAERAEASGDIVENTQAIGGDEDNRQRANAPHELEVGDVHSKRCKEAAGGLQYGRARLPSSPVDYELEVDGDALAASSKVRRYGLAE